MLSLGLGLFGKPRRATKGGRRIVYRSDDKEDQPVPTWQDAGALTDNPAGESTESTMNESERTAPSSSCDESTDSVSCTSRARGGPLRISKYCPGNALVNLERANSCTSSICKPLQRSLELDETARWHAQNMADALTVYHSDPAALCHKLELRAGQILGENAAIGTTVQDVHATMIKNKHDLVNMVDPRYTEMGMATARAIDSRGRETIYLCQLFRG